MADEKKPEEKNGLLKKLLANKPASLAIGFTSASALFMSPDLLKTVTDMFGVLSESQMAQFGLFFTMASFIHSGRVKKEIRSNFEGLTHAIEKVSAALREDLKQHGDRLDNLYGRVDRLERAQVQENKPNKKEDMTC